jgi:hypothetical protein
LNYLIIFSIIIGGKIIHIIILILINSSIFVFYLTLPANKLNFAEVTHIRVKFVQPWPNLTEVSITLNSKWRCTAVLKVKDNLF